MKKLFLLLLFSHVSSAAIHSLRFFLTASSGVPNFPELVVVALIDETLAGYCDANKKIIELKQDWMENLTESKPEHFEFYRLMCFQNDLNFARDMIKHLKQRKQSEGVHVFQEMTGCEWDDETGDVTGYMQYGYNGEDFMSFNVTNLTWTASKQEAEMKKEIWNSNRTTAMNNKKYLTETLLRWLEEYLESGSSFLLRKELPSVSLLQKTSSSPVSCHASGFYPDRFSLFWRKDGEEIHEGVDHGEILPNHDGTFQMSVDLDLSSVTPEDWRRYECVFQFSAVKDDIVTKLDKAEIRTNEEDPSNMTVPIIAAVITVVVVLAVFRFIVYKKKKAKSPASSHDSGPENSEETNSNNELLNTVTELPHVSHNVALQN